MNIAVITDGGSHNNGGMCGIGVVILDADTTEILCEIGEAIGEGTNTHAEYNAFERGIREAIGVADHHKVKKVMLLADSNLVVAQMKGEWKAKNTGDYVKKCTDVLNLLRPMVKEIVIDHIPREYNNADALASKAIENAVEQKIEKKYPFLRKVC